MDRRDSCLRKILKSLNWYDILRRSYEVIGRIRRSEFFAWWLVIKCLWGMKYSNVPFIKLARPSE